MALFTAIMVLWHAADAKHHMLMNMLFPHLQNGDHDGDKPTPCGCQKLRTTKPPSILTPTLMHMKTNIWKLGADLAPALRALNPAAQVWQPMPGRQGRRSPGSGVGQETGSVRDPPPEAKKEVGLQGEKKKKKKPGPN